MDDHELDEAVCLVDFFHLYLADAERGVVRAPQEYALRFPGHEALVIREYAELLDRPQGSGGGAMGFSTLPGYRTLRELGRGGQGTVYLAEDLSLRRLVALKVVRTTLGSPSPAQRARLEREVGILALLDHPNICAVYRAHLDNDPPFVAMRYIAGPTLAELIAAPAATARWSCRPECRTDLERLLHFFEDAAQALHAAHEAGIVHRDIKPGNVVCDDAGRPVLLDFGLARSIDGDELCVTRTGELFGTPAYMSPEQLLRAPDALDRRTDVYSLGVTLFECLTRRRPFDEPSQLQLERAICETPTPRASRFNRVLPTDLDLVLETALEKDPRRRYATALDLARELRRVRERRPVLARPTGAILRTRRWTQRNPAVATAIVLLLLGAAGLVGALVRLSAEIASTEEARRLAEGRTLASAALTMLERDPVKAFDMALASHDLAPGVDSRGALFRAMAAQQVTRVIELSTGNGNTAAVSPDRSAMACLDFSGTRLLVISLPDGQHLMSESMPNRSLALDVTNHGTLVAAGFNDGRVAVYHGPDAASARILRAGTGVVRSVAFSPDESLLATGGDDDLVRLWNVDSGQELGAMSGSEGPPCGLAFSRDGSLLASWVHELPGLPDRPDPTVRLWSISERRLAATLVGHKARVRLARFSADGRLLASASDDGSARVWELPEGRCRFVLKLPGQVSDVAFSPDGSQLATAFDPGPPGLSLASGAWVFSIADGSRRLELLGHEARTVSSIEWSADGRRLVSGSYDGTARIWDAADGQQQACVRSTQGYVLSANWLDGGAQLLIRYSRQATVVCGRDDAGLPRLTGHEAPILEASFRSDGARVATADTKGLTLVHDTRTGALLASLQDGSAAVLHTAFCGDDLVLTASDDGWCRLFDANGGPIRWRVHVGTEPVRLLRVLPGGARFLASSGDLLALFEVHSDGVRKLAEFRGHGAELRCLDVSPDGLRLATGAADQSVRLWDLSTGACQKVLKDWLPTAYETEMSIYSVLFHLDGGGLLTSSEDGCMRDYQLPRGELVYDTGSTARVARAVWLNDGQRMVTMPQWAPVLGLLSIDSFERKQIDPPVVGRLLAMDVSPDGSLLLAASTDGTTMLWRTTDFKLWASVRGHTGPVLFAAFNPDGSQFITTSTDGTARLWPTNPAAEARARRPQIVPLVAR